MEHQELYAISFEDAIGISQQRHRETTEELRLLRQELRERDVVIKRMQSKLDAQCAAELQNRKLQLELRQLKDGLAQLLREDPHLGDKLMAMTSIDHNDAAATLSVMPLVDKDAIRAQPSKKKNYVARLPFEMRSDIFLNLDRWSLDRAGFACPQFHAVVDYLAGGSLRVLGRVRLVVSTSEDWNPHLAWVAYSSDPMALKNGSTSETVSRQWSFNEMDAATVHCFIGVLRHASLTKATLSGPLPIQLLQALSAADLDVTIGDLNIDDVALEPAQFPVARSALTSFSSVRRLELEIPFDLLTNDLLIALRNIGVAHFVVRWRYFNLRIDAGDHRVLTNVYFGGYPDLDVGLTEFLFRGSELEHEEVALKFPAARVPRDFCQRLLKAAISDGSRSTVDLSFVAAVGDLTVELEGFEEFASKPNGHTIVYKVPKSPASNMLLELKIVTVENAPNAWKLVEFRQSKKPPTIARDGGRRGAGSDERYGFFGGGFGGWA